MSNQAMTSSVLDLLSRSVEPSMRRQFIYFAVIGLLLNLALYAAYILLTDMVLGCLTAMTVTYCSGVIMGFLLNRRFTFGFDGDRNSAFARYIVAYLLGYLINFAGLWLFSVHWSIPHEVVQGCIFFVLAVLLFFLQKYWVFKKQSQSHSARLISPGR